MIYRKGLSPVERFLACACLVLASAMQNASAAIPADERNALIALYSSTHGNDWRDNGNWCVGRCPASGDPTFNAPGTECTWSGIDCDAGETHVTGITLFHNHMVGPLPSLQGLTALQLIDLDNDEILGPLPDFSGLTSLWLLDLHQNDIDGAMPPISGLTTLTTVRLFGNRLSGSLPELQGLVNLEIFNADSNQFSGAIPGLPGLVALQEFDVADNALTGPIPDLDGLVALVTFEAENNQMTGSVPDLSGLASLVAFRVGNNRLSGPVPAFPENGITGPYSTLCPNPLDTTPGPNDASWDTHTGYTPWWATPYANNLCDDIFTDAFDVAGLRRVNE
jgi:hypothetical protein